MLYIGGEIEIGLHGILPQLQSVRKSAPTFYDWDSYSGSGTVCGHPLASLYHFPVQWTPTLQTTCAPVSLLQVSSFFSPFTRPFFGTHSNIVPGPVFGEQVTLNSRLVFLSYPGSFTEEAAEKMPWLVRCFELIMAREESGVSSDIGT